MNIKSYFYICVLFLSTLTANELRIVTNLEPPTNYYLHNKTITGTTVDIVEEIKRRLSINTKIEVMTWARSYMIAKKNPNVVIFTAGKSQERVDLGFHFIGPVSTRKHILWKKKGKSINIKKLQDIKRKNLIVGAMRDDWRAKFMKSEGLNVQEVSLHKQNLKKLLKGRIDLWISSDIEAPIIAKEMGVDIESLEIAYVFKKLPSFIMLSKDTSLEIVNEWRNTYLKMQSSQFFKQTSKKWSKILNINLDYSDDKGFYVK